MVLLDVLLVDSDEKSVGMLKVVNLPALGISVVTEAILSAV